MLLSSSTTRMRDVCDVAGVAVRDAVFVMCEESTSRLGVV